MPVLEVRVPSKRPHCMNPGDLVRLKVNVERPDHKRGEVGIVETIIPNDMYPVEVWFDGSDHITPCWEHELELVP